MLTAPADPLQWPGAVLYSGLQAPSQLQQHFASAGPHPNTATLGGTAANTLGPSFPTSLPPDVSGLHWDPFAQALPGLQTQAAAELWDLQHAAGTGWLREQQLPKRPRREPSAIVQRTPPPATSRPPCGVPSAAAVASAAARGGAPAAGLGSTGAAGARPAGRLLPPVPRWPDPPAAAFATATAAAAASANAAFGKAGAGAGMAAGPAGMAVAGSAWQSRGPRPPSPPADVEMSAHRTSSRQGAVAPAGTPAAGVPGQRSLGPHASTPPTMQDAGRTAMAAVELLTALHNFELVSTSNLASRLLAAGAGGGAAQTAAGPAAQGSGPAATAATAAVKAGEAEEAEALLDDRVEAAAQWVARRLQEQGWCMEPEPQEWLVQLLVARNVASAEAPRQQHEEQQQQQQQQQQPEQLQYDASAAAGTTAMPAASTSAADPDLLPCYVAAVLSGLVPGVGFRRPKSRSPSASPTPAARAGDATGGATGSCGGGSAASGRPGGTPPPATAAAATGLRRARLRLVPVAELPQGFPRGPADGCWVVALAHEEVAAVAAVPGSGGVGGDGGFSESAAGDAASIREAALTLVRAATSTTGYLACVDPGGGMSIDQELYAWVKTSPAPLPAAVVGNHLTPKRQAPG